MTPYVFDKAIDSGKTLLVTAGVDGDEYAGIEAAYQLIERYRKQKFAGRLVIVPIVNVAGFRNESSWNPEDNKYPKLVGIGKPYGSVSERLMHWLTTSYAIHADVWMDLHDGSLTEVLTPFVGMWETGKKEVDARVVEIQHALSVDIITREPARFLGSARYLAKHGCAYLLAESGERGERKREAIQKHVEWVETAMRVLQMIGGSIIPYEKPLYTHIRTYNVETDGIWNPAYGRPRTFKKSESFGSIHGLDGKKKKELKAKEDCLMLWGKVTAATKKGETLIGVAY